MPTATRRADLQQLDERLTFLTDVPPAIPVSSLTQAGGTATANTATAHNFDANDYVIVAGATPADYNGEVQIAVLDADTFTYPVSGNPSSPASGTMTATFHSDASGGGTEGWRTFATVFGHMHPLSTNETLQAQAIQSEIRFEAEIQYRADITPKMQLRWTPFRATTARTFNILGPPKPHPQFPHDRLLIEVGEVQ